MVGLRKLGLSWNRELTVLPAGLCALAGLEELDLNSCGLMALPKGMDGLAALRKLDVRWNEELTALPAGRGLLEGLQVLWFSSYPGLAALKNLQRGEGLHVLLAHLAAQGGELAAVDAG